MSIKNFRVACESIIDGNEKLVEEIVKREERIDELIDRKRSVATGLVESGEAWLSELSGQELADLWHLDEKSEEELP